MNILICTIVRNEIKHLDRWFHQINAIRDTYKDITFGLSVYENDSNDGSKEKLKSFDFGNFESFSLSVEKRNTPFFIGGKHPVRTELLAQARNKCMYQFPYLNIIDNVLFLESDILFNVNDIGKVLNHEKEYGFKMDVFTPKSIHPHTEDLIYDSWGSRKTAEQNDWRDEDHNLKGFMEMWAVFNCFALYNAEPIKKGIAFGGVNPRTGQPDCDPVVICENFRKNGYNKIYWDTNIKVKHFCE